MKSLSVTLQMKAAEQYFAAAFFFYATQGGLRMNEIHCTVHFCCTVYHVM